MTSSVKRHPNYYETLGLSPTASQSEIANAFSKLMGMFGARSLAAAAQVAAAFEVLRNPAKRRAYDRLIGLTLVPDTSQWKVTWAPQSNSAYYRAAAKKRDGHSGSERSTKSSTHVPPELEEVASSQVKARPPIVRPHHQAALAERPEPPVEAQAAPKPDETTKSPSLNRSRPVLDRSTASEKPLAYVEDSAFDLKRPALVIGGLIAAAAIIGAYAGASVKGDEEPLLSEGPVTMAHAAKRAHRIGMPLVPKVAAATAFAPPPITTADLETHAKHGLKILPPAMRHIAINTQSRSPNETLGEDQQSTSAAQDEQPADLTGSQTSASEPPQAIGAELPLPHQIIARTIQRIGYSCGTVVTAASVGSTAPGVYNVTCSSGQTYEAREVRGHYRFRRSGR